MNGAYFLYPNIKDRILLLDDNAGIDWYTISAGHNVYSIPSSNLNQDFYEYVATISGKMVMLVKVKEKVVNIIFNNKKDEAVFVLKYVD